MTGLVLKLSPNERLLINGAVIENGNRKTKISIMTENTNVLRLKDAIHPESANTPVARVCYIAQLILSGDADPVQGRNQLLLGVEKLNQVFSDHNSQSILSSASRMVVEDQIYQALRRLRELLPCERKLLKGVNK